MKTIYIVLFITSCCQIMAKPKQLFTPNAPTGFGVSNSTICSGSSALLSVNCASGVVNWFTSAAGGNVIGTESPFSVNPVVTTTYYASCKDGINESSRATGPTITVLADLAVGARIPQINLSGTLNNSDPTFRRTLAFSQGAACALSNTGTAVHYTTKTFTLATASTVTVSLLSTDGASLSPDGADTFMALYSSFNPTAVCTNIIAANDDAGEGAASRITASTPLSAGTYTIVITSANNVPSNTNDATLPWSFTAVVQASSIGVASAPSNLQVNGGTNTFDICPTVSVALTGSCANGTIKWYTSLTATTAVGSGSPLTIVPAITTTYYASCENVCSASARVATQEITVTQLPDIPSKVSVSQAAVCFGTSITLSATCDAVPSFNINLTANEKELFKAGLLNLITPINNGLKTLKWYDQAIGGTAIGTGTDLVITPTANITYYAACENACGSSPRVDKAVSVTPIPTAPTSIGVSICSGKTASLSAICITGNIFWYSSPTALSGTAKSPFISPTLTVNTDYYVACESGGIINCVSERTKVTVIINALPTATASNNTPICAGTTLNLLGGNGLNTYVWTGVNSFTATSQNPTIPSASTAGMGSYQVVVTDANGCTATATTSVIINQMPTTPTTQADVQVIFGNGISLTATVCSGTLKWYQSADNQVITMPVSPALTSQYYAKCEETASGITCISNQSNTLTLTVLTPVPPVVTGATLCTGSNVALTATGCVGTFVLIWYQNSNDALVTMPISPTATTDYYAKCVQTFHSVTSTSGNSTVVTVRVLNPLIPVSTGGTIYQGQKITLNATGCEGAALAIKWYETATNNPVSMPVSPIMTTHYYAECEQTANSVTCVSLASNDVTVIVVNRIFVDINKRDAPIQDGNTWATAYGDLQTALATATANVEVWVAKGTYQPTTTITKTIYFKIPTDIKVYGGFIGTEDALNIRDFRKNSSILSGEIGNTTIFTDNSYHVVLFDSSSNHTVLDGFTITGGNANFNPNNKSSNQPTSSVSPSTSTIETGGGVCFQNGSNPLIVNCIIINNAAIEGGGIYAGDASKPTIINCKIIGNQSTFGSGIYLENGSDAMITNTLIAGNKGIGSVYNNRSNPELTNCTLSGNGGYGGGIFNSNSQPIIKNSILWGNAAPFNDTPSIISNSMVQGGYEGIGNLNYDPQFVAASSPALAPTTTGDYHLKANSLAIDRGENGIFQVTDGDLDGNSRRFLGGRIDMGAYEFQGSSTVKLVISIASGDWSENSTWNQGYIPQLDDTVIIDSNHQITVNTLTEIAKNIEFRGTGKIQFNSSATKLTLGF